jgi:lactam utilization protein B
MIKMLICLISALALAAMTLQLRQQRMELAHQNSELNDRINSHQAKLWSQQLQIAVYTAPNAIQQTVKTHDLKMVSQSPVRSKNANWIDVSANPDAE